MQKIKDILSIDLSEDIKNVINLEDHSEIEIQKEIESYIITEGIAKHLDSFTTQFTSNIKETGVWLSGFYGSGKSYFGKMLGYIIDNQVINGTPARDRFLLRLKGISNESILENNIRRLDSINSKVITLDIAKQNTDNGLAYTLFSNFLKHQGFREDLYGYIEFDLLIDGKLEDFKEIIQASEDVDWDELKKSNRKVAKATSNAFLKMGYNETEYKETLETYKKSIEDFSANKLKLELERYLQFSPNETLVFIFDEASEAISQKKFTLLDLEGISEALSSISNKVWTIAIAQEKLDDVINNANVNKSQLTKVTDRFKTKIHLESTEVDVIIRSRLLKKTEQAYSDLKQYYDKNEGLVTDATNLKSSFPTKTESSEEFSDYYPFHRYQFNILQKFLFSSNALVETQVAARGMIITTFDVLRKQLQNHQIYNFSPVHSICTEAQHAPPISLVNKYDTAKKILAEKNIPIDGENLLKTIHFLSESEVISPTLENITKGYISNIENYYSFKQNIQESLKILVEAKILLFSNHNYKITSDLEGKLLEEMKDFEVDFSSKKRFLINHIKDNNLFSAISKISEGHAVFEFNITSDQDDLLVKTAGEKQLNITVYSLFNISDNRQNFLEDQKNETQYEKNRLTLIPDNNDFKIIDKLIADISRYRFMEEKYQGETDQNKKQIINQFSLIREEKEKELRFKVNTAYHNASLIYMFDEYRLNEDSFKGTINDQQRKLIKNIYTKRLSSSLSEDLVSKIFNSRKEGLSKLLSGSEFKFFDDHGNFTGDHLQVVEQINEKIKNRYIDGKTLESDLRGAPWGYSFGTIVSTLAALLRAGRLSVKFNSETYFSHDQSGVQEAFKNATKFKSASFKSVTATLTSAQKNNAVSILRDLEIDSVINRKVDWSINDYDLADSIREFSERFIQKIATLKATIDNFDALFPAMHEQKERLLEYSAKVTEKNYIEKVEFFLNNSENFKRAIETINNTQKFLQKNFPKLQGYKRFIEQVKKELEKSEQNNTTISCAYDDFTDLYKKDMVKNFNDLKEKVQTIKDAYFNLIRNASERMTHEYQILSGKIDAAYKKVNDYPKDINVSNFNKLDALKKYCAERIIKIPEIEYEVTCQKSGYALSEIVNYTNLVPIKSHELDLLFTQFIKERPLPAETAALPSENSNDIQQPKKPRKVSVPIKKGVITVQEYKSFLTNQLSALAMAKPEEEIELELQD